VEGGAYGGMAMVSSSHPVFACASYRDPNLASTLKHFEDGLQSVAKGLPQEAVDQSIIGTIGRMDSPKTPHQKGLSETMAILCGRTVEQRQMQRDAVLRATSENLAKTAAALFDNRNTSITVLGSASTFDKAEKEQVFLVREQLSND
jgi:Zn-dependent M16 (insulinase) family peptidase